MRRLLALLLAPAALAVIAAGCGGGSHHGTPRPASTAARATIGTAQTKLGRVLVDAQGRTLYLFEKDKGTSSSCYGACASIWPPLTTSAMSKAVAGRGVAVTKLGSSKRTDGKAEVTYDGHPLYTYAGDTKRGDVQGEGLDQFGAEWYALSPNGRKVEDGS
jgi:predicted lipoprotein with Yx(FWY)xxD motif